MTCIADKFRKKFRHQIQNLFSLLNAGSPEQIDVQQWLQRDIYWGQSRELQYDTLHSSRGTRRTGEN
ncbi:hypothetical protein DPMN_129619 [Dreissena polymorpha]|uniref:Uncharacterized protein n=1 Tax=Dreissena polymorpha TaxID=45954 RepID=A0A9D4H1H9_DREPO|nr:hypothetical protein DPMN_129619 [Dreissena polymorpha]